MHTWHAAIYANAPAQRVWSALTDPHRTPEFHFGLQLCSTWSEDAEVSIRSLSVDPAYAAAAQLSGTVVQVEPGRRLTYSLGGSATDPQAWITWEIDASGPGLTRIALTYDDLDQTADPDQAEVVLRLLSNLKSTVESLPADQTLS